MLLNSIHLMQTKNILAILFPHLEEIASEEDDR